MNALGAALAIAWARVAQMPALTLKRSSRLSGQPYPPNRTHVMPGLRGTPAGMTTMSAPLRAASAPLSGGRKPST